MELAKMIGSFTWSKEVKKIPWNSDCASFNLHFNINLIYSLRPT